MSDLPFIKKESNGQYNYQYYKRNSADAAPNDRRDVTGPLNEYVAHTVTYVSGSGLFRTVDYNQTLCLLIVHYCKELKLLFNATCQMHVKKKRKFIVKIILIQKVVLFVSLNIFKKEEEWKFNHLLFMN